MRNIVKSMLAFTVAASVLAAPAYADKYVFYGDGHHNWNGHGKKYGHWKQPHYVKRVYVTRPYVKHVYYNDSYYNDSYYSSGYSTVRCTNRVNPLGLLLGGAAGGIVGHQIGKGKGNIAATIGGAVLGSAIGAGATYQDCSQQVFQEVPVGTPMVWQTADSSEYYSITPTRDYRTNGRYCREYQAIATVAGSKQQTYGTACMQPDGSWEIIN